MARLPDATSLGQTPSLASSRPIATYDTTAEARGAEAQARGAEKMAEGVQKMGQHITSAAGTLADAFKRETEQASKLQEAQADAYLTSEATKLRAKINEAATPEEAEGYKQQHRELLEGAAGVLQDPKQRELWKLRRIPTIAQTETLADGRIFGLKRDAAFADANTRLEELKKAGALPGADHNDIVSKSHKLIDELENSKYISKEDAVNRRQRFAEGYSWEALQAMPAEERAKSLAPAPDLGGKAKQAFDFFTSKGWTPAQAAGIVGNLMAESKLNTSARAAGDGSDGTDSIGIAQWNSDRAERLKKFAAALGKPVTDYATQLEFVDLELRTSHSAAGDKLLQAKTARDAAAAFVVHFERPKGSNYGAESSHGWGHRLRYAEGLFAQGTGGQASDPKGAALTAFLSPQHRRQLETQTTRELETNGRQQVAATRQEIASVKSLISDDALSIATTGKPVVDLTPSRVEAVMGPEAAAEFSDNRERAQRFHHETNDLDQIPNDEIMRRLENLRPVGGKAGFSKDQEWYDRAKKAADPIIKEREQDPAAAVDRQPDVHAAKQNASLDRPETFAPVVRARMEAQTRLGIPEDIQVPITRAEAKQLWRPIQLAAPEEQLEVLKDTVKQLQEAFGDHSDTALQMVLREGRADKATREAAAVVIRRLAREQVPTPEEAKALDDAQKDAATQAAIAPLLEQFGVKGVGDPTTGIGVRDGQQGPPMPTYPVPKAEHISALRSRIQAAPTLEDAQDIIAKFNAGNAFGPGSAEAILKAHPVKMPPPKAAEKPAPPTPTTTRVIEAVRDENGNIIGSKVTSPAVKREVIGRDAKGRVSAVRETID